MPRQDAQFMATPLSSMMGVASQTEDKLARLNLHNIYDLCLNLPFRYEDRSFISSAKDAELHLGENGNALPRNFLLTVTAPPRFKAKITEISTVDHEQTVVKLIFFHVNSYFLQRLAPGTKVIAWGSLKPGENTPYGWRPPQISHPEINFLDNELIVLPTRLSPIYHLTSGISQQRLRDLTASALELLAHHPLEELIPESLNPFTEQKPEISLERFLKLDAADIPLLLETKRTQLALDLTTALLLTHNPHINPQHEPQVLEALPSFKRICFEEILAYKLCIFLIKEQQKGKKAPKIELDQAKHELFLSTLPYTPTLAQSRVFTEIMVDCAREQAMNRLVHGDVGSGKTLVAAMVMLQFAVQGYQAALLAPTELLAQQHQRKLSALFAPMGITVILVTGKLKKKEREELLKQAATGQGKIFVGTHALFQKSLQYQNLGLVIIDEEHRFGVEQRESLLNKAPPGQAAHELLMTATPIPRSLQLSIYSDIDVSTIDMLPQGRTPIVTAVIRQERLHTVMERLYWHCSQGNQAYWVCPLVEENEVIDATSVKERLRSLQAALPTLKIGLLHAQMNDKAKTETMESFINQEIQILVATTIVEVGVDVPNASVIVIENADRLGLAQLHQLRGRVGRGSKESYCLLLYEDNPLRSPEQRARGQQRLQIMRSCTNGFDIANQDLLMRGPGEFFGTQQAGKESFRFAESYRDYALIEYAGKIVSAMLEFFPELSHLLIERWFPDFLTTLEVKNAQDVATAAAPDTTTAAAPAAAPAASLTTATAKDEDCPQGSPRLISSSKAKSTANSSQSSASISVSSLAPLSLQTQAAPAPAPALVPHLETKPTQAHAARARDDRGRLAAKPPVLEGLSTTREAGISQKKMSAASKQPSLAQRLMVLHEVARFLDNMLRVMQQLHEKREHLVNARQGKTHPEPGDDPASVVNEIERAIAALSPQERDVSALGVTQSSQRDTITDPSNVPPETFIPLFKEDRDDSAAATASASAALAITMMEEDSKKALVAEEASTREASTREDRSHDASTQYTSIQDASTKKSCSQVVPAAVPLASLAVAPNNQASAIPAAALSGLVLAATSSTPAPHSLVIASASLPPRSVGVDADHKAPTAMSQADAPTAISQADANTATTVEVMSITAPTSATTAKTVVAATQPHVGERAAVSDGDSTTFTAAAGGTRAITAGITTTATIPATTATISAPAASAAITAAASPVTALVNTANTLATAEVGTLTLKTEYQSPERGEIKSAAKSD